MLGRTLLQILRDSTYTTVLSGYAMVRESGYPAIRDSDISYDIEQKYGYSPDEMFSSLFYATRTEEFFRFYRNEILSALDTPPGKGYYELAELERRGLIHSVITRRVFGLPKAAGCQNVIDLHGSVYDNYCPRCGRWYPVEYIRNAKRVPLCESCNTAIRPKVCLFGEAVDNQVITRATEEVERANVLLVLGTNLKSGLSQLVHYYEGKKLVLVNEEPHFSDKHADVVIHERVDDTLEKVLKEVKEQRES